MRATARSGGAQPDRYPARRMGIVIGLLGGVGSGKSAVAKAFAAHGCLVLDADAEARAVVELPEVRAALVERFGPGILDGAGNLDRARLAALAFDDPLATADLNAIVHPQVRARLNAALDAAGAFKPTAPAGNPATAATTAVGGKRATPEAARGRDIVLDVPLLLESPLAARVDRWVFIDTPETLRDARLASRGWSPGERVRREARQAALAEKRARADAVLENSGAIGDLGRAVEALLLRWRTT
jgi:dephospho-CoA kinase